MSLCDVCLNPGACCSRMAISGRMVVGDDVPGGRGMVDPGAPMSRERAEHLMMAAGLPFMPTHQEPDGTWRYTCTRVTAIGRCAIYEDRPKLCRSFRAGSDPLCVHYWNSEPDGGGRKET